MIRIWAAISHRIPFAMLLHVISTCTPLKSVSQSISKHSCPGLFIWVYDEFWMVTAIERAAQVKVYGKSSASTCRSHRYDERDSLLDSKDEIFIAPIRLPSPQDNTRWPIRLKWISKMSRTKFEHMTTICARDGRTQRECSTSAYYRATLESCEQKYCEKMKPIASVQWIFSCQKVGSWRHHFRTFPLCKHRTPLHRTITY